MARAASKLITLASPKGRSAAALEPEIFQRSGVEQVFVERRLLIFFAPLAFGHLELNIGFFIVTGKGICLQFHCNIIVAREMVRKFLKPKGTFAAEPPSK